MISNLIDSRVNQSKLQKLREYFAFYHVNKFRLRIRLVAILTGIVVVLASAGFFYHYNNKPAEAIEFGLGNDYEKIIALNESVSGNVPLSISTISTANLSGDKRVVALLILLEKYRSPMAKPSVAEAFVAHADKNGFGDKWYLLPAISGIESAFGKIIPTHGHISSYNAWGWSGGSKYGRWSYFESWEDAIEQVSRGIAVGYKQNTNLEPEKMMATYCPPCALPQARGVWAKTVNKYIEEAKSIYKAL